MKKRRWIILFGLVALGGGVLWVLFGREPIQEGRCRLVRRKADPDSQLIGLAFQMLPAQTARPDSVRDLPTGFKRPCYYEMKSGDRRIPLVVNLSERPALCLDTNGDGVLSEERCFTAKPRRETPLSSSKHRFGPMSLASQDNSSNADGRFYVNCYRVDAPGPLTTFPAFIRTGKLQLDGRIYRVAVVDGDCDGRYRSVISLPLDHAWRMPASDLFAIDLNHNGEFEISLFTRSEVMPLGRLVQVDGAYYAVDIVSDGRSLTLSRTEPQLGTLAVEAGGAAVELKLWSDAADRYLSPDHQWQLPAGKYTATYLALEQRDASGYLRSLSVNTSSATTLGPFSFFEIKPGETTSVKIGPPFAIRTDVQRAGPGNITISAVLVGCAGEEYELSWRRHLRASSGPAFKIVDEQGMMLAEGKFEYG